MTKIICTIGKHDSVCTLAKMIEAGMCIARLNFSHGNFDEHLQKVKNIKEAEKITGKKIEILGDLKGIEIRLGGFNNGDSVDISKNDTVILQKDYVSKAENVIALPVDISLFVEELKENDVILLDDGKIQLNVESIEKEAIITTALNTGVISERKSINIPNVHLNIPFVTEYDKEVIKFCQEHKFDYLALSFCRNEKDLDEVIDTLLENDPDYSVVSYPSLIVKIEDKEGVSNIQNFSWNPYVDGIMVARGDLGVEIPQEEVPVVERQVIKECLPDKNGTKCCFSVVATQMLESMCENPRPTRAEVNDVFTAVELGADFIMLSGETASGNYPVEAVETMRKIVDRAERAKEEK